MVRLTSPASVKEVMAVKFEINLFRVLGDHLLAGRALGSRHLTAMMEIISRELERRQVFDPNRAEKILIVLDFAQVTVATSSYLAAAVLPLWSWKALLEGNAYPVVANLNPGIQDEIEFVLRPQNTAVWTGRQVSGDLHDVGLVGTLDESLRTTLRYFSPSSELSATELASSDEKIGSTAWNNRLSSLYEFRLLHRRKVGRRQVYSLSWSEASHG